LREKKTDGYCYHGCILQRTFLADYCLPPVTCWGVFMTMNQIKSELQFLQSMRNLKSAVKHGGQEAQSDPTRGT